MDIFNDLPIGMEVENFNYKYTEGKGDKGKFTIVTDFVDIVDHPSLQFKMPLKYSGDGYLVIALLSLVL